MKSLLVMLAALLLCGCMGRQPLPAELPALDLPKQLHVQQWQQDQRLDWLLVIQREGESLRWSLLDLLGMPQARQMLDHQRWQADGLLPPNPAARELFAAVLFALTPEDTLGQLYPEARQQGQQRWLGERWQVTYQSTDEFSLNMPQGLRYLVSPLPSESTP